MVARAFAGVLLFAWVVAARAAEPCTPAFARVVSVQGKVELRRGGTDWQAAELNTTLCAGDMVRVHQRSRSAILLSNETTLRLDQGTVLTLTAPDREKATLLDQISGGMHVITRTPRPFRVKTPFVNANVEGTEFAVRVNESSANIAVYEGRVIADNDLGSIALAKGEEAFATKTAAPRKELVIRPRDAVAWTLYFPTIFDYQLDAGIAGTPEGSARQRSIDLYHNGRPADALAALEGVPEDAVTPRFLTYRAGLLLLVGRLDEAKPDIEHALRLSPNSADAYSLLAVIAVVDNEKDKALELADKAVALDRTPSALMARSYARQASFQIELARADVQQATELAPQQALAWARLAELEMARGELQRAVATAKRATDLDPRLSKTQTVLGFASLASANSSAARTSFEAAIALDQVDPLPRLGLGLAKIREGGLEAGRVDVEIAVSLDPGNSLARSYVGKAYFEERRNALAASQLSLAKQFDPQDPTPWFYDAIRKQTENRPVEALSDLAKSSQLNENRAVQRSQLLLDSDAALRNTSRARIYNDLGFEQLEVVEAVKSLLIDRTDYSSHRFLSDYYATLPRHELARDSELLQAQLLQPVATSPVFPRLASDGLSLFATPLSSNPGLNEYGQSFEQAGVHVTAEVNRGERHNSVDELVVSGLADNLSFSVGAYRLETDGFRQNNDQRHLIGNAFLLAQLSTSTSVQVELRDSGRKFGDPAILFFSDQFLPNLRFEDKRTSLRFGLRTTIDSESTLLTTFSRRRLHFEAVDETLFGRSVDTELANLFELSHIYKRLDLSLRSGIGIFGGTINRSFTPTGGPEIVSDPAGLRRSNAYIYADLRLTRWSTVQLGASFDHFEGEQDVKRSQFNPKVGWVLSPTPSTTVRLAAMRTLKGPLTAEQTLEPTEVVGFNQFFDDDDGVESRRLGVAIDHRLGDKAYSGVELSQRKLLRIPGPGGREAHFTERFARGYFYTTLANSMAVSVGPEFVDQIGEPDAFNDQLIARARTFRLPVQLRWFDANGMFARVRGIYIRQSGMFSDGPFQQAVLPGRDDFWIVDAGFGYRLPGRRGVFEIGIRNLFDAKFQFQDIDLRNPTIARQRLMAARLSMYF